MQTSDWKQRARKLLWPILSFCVGAILGLSQKQSPTAVNILLGICAFWVWIVILSFDWWKTASGWKLVVRALLPLPPLVLLFWGAIVFFRPEIPSNSYPWLSTNYIVDAEGHTVKAVQLHLLVREDPASPDSLKGVMALSSLYDLNLMVSTPQLVSPNGTYYCSVTQPIKAAEWNNRDALTTPVGIFQLPRETNVLKIEGASRNATWQGTVVMHSNGDWEESLTGWVNTARGPEPVRVEETHNQNGTVNGLERPIQVTGEVLIKSGVPFEERFESTKDICPPIS